jgi:hypothetical protein
MNGLVRIRIIVDGGDEDCRIAASFAFVPSANGGDNADGCLQLCHRMIVACGDFALAHFEPKHHTGGAHTGYRGIVFGPNEVDACGLFAC